MRITILSARLSSYMVAFYRELARSEGCELQLVFHEPSSDAPYKAFDVSFCKQSFTEPADRQVLLRRVAEFQPDCILMSSWNFRGYMYVCRRMKRRGTLVISMMDNQWRGTLKQWLGVATSRWFLKPAIDGFLVAGDRQAAFARRLGFHLILYGCYAADVERFVNVGDGVGVRRGFLFVGRMSRDKGIDLLAEAYRLYLQMSNDTWPLRVIGVGPCASEFDSMTGVSVDGFVQPDAIPEAMAQSACLVLPSRYEPWGVVLHEAAAAGLLIVCTAECGACTYFVRDGVNGYVVDASAAALAGALRRVSEKGPERRHEMETASRTLGLLWSPAAQAAYVTDSLRSLVSRVTHSFRTPN